ncbi:hypothetical protein BpHYR1_050166 [Brachionus plicatilis]|uniref:Uncharacterized protein n=1 Tax=Brachionus plicatilis TaxID=10195 RepID=A0A3M7PI23_BRAPC|nr:hypothetical protein BpHYR1_050166 [Brachionus plicatilis]
MNRTSKIILTLICIGALIGIGLFFGLFFGLRSSKSSTTSSTTKEATTSTVQDDFFPLNFTINAGANFTIEMKEGGLVVNNINSSDFTIYLGNKSQITTTRISPSLFEFNSALTVSSIVNLEPRNFILYPKINTEIYVVYSTTISSRITTENTANSTVFFKPKLEFLISKLNGKESSGRSFSVSLDSFKSTSDLVTFSNTTFKFTVLSKDCIFYESSENIYLDDNNIMSFLGNGRQKKILNGLLFQPSETQASSSSPKGFESDEDSEDEVLSKRPRIESDQNEAFDRESKSCENCGSKMTKRRYWACSNKCAR